MRNQTKIKQLLIAHLESIMQTQGVIVLTPENVQSIIGGAINRCYEADAQALSQPPVMGSACAFCNGSGKLGTWDEYRNCDKCNGTGQKNGLLHIN